MPDEVTPKAPVSADQALSSCCGAGIDICAVGICTSYWCLNCKSQCKPPVLHDSVADLPAQEEAPVSLTEVERLLEDGNVVAGILLGEGRPEESVLVQKLCHQVRSLRSHAEGLAVALEKAKGYLRNSETQDHCSSCHFIQYPEDLDMYGIGVFDLCNCEVGDLFRAEEEIEEALAKYYSAFPLQK